MQVFYVVNILSRSKPFFRTLFCMLLSMHFLHFPFLQIYISFSKGNISFLFSKPISLYFYTKRFLCELSVFFFAGLWDLLNLCVVSLVLSCLLIRLEGTDMSVSPLFACGLCTINYLVRMQEMIIKC